MSTSAKLGIYKGILRPTVLYARESWVMNKNADQTQKKLERKTMRGTLGGRKREDGYVRRTNEEVYASIGIQQ